MRIHWGVVALISGILVTSFAVEPAFAQGRGRGQNQGQAQGAATTPAVVVQFVFNDHDRDLILKHFAPTSGLPPGLDKQLRRNGTLPPGLQKKLQPFPRTLLDQLRPLPAGYRYGIADGHVMIYRLDTFVIADIILHVVR